MVPTTSLQKKLLTGKALASNKPRVGGWGRNLRGRRNRSLFLGRHGAQLTNSQSCVKSTTKISRWFWLHNKNVNCDERLRHLCTLGVPDKGPRHIQSGVILPARILQESLPDSSLLDMSQIFARYLFPRVWLERPKHIKH